ncbi:glutathione S-transferase [Penicillium daleae]|uniref:glutathione transferase n=1 Tax=Penicillium daleae TaxID=63821 RepID=A0AAD6G169_9EURO|nr:glutathione S-transferase [Penicillium daleae]KAJ5444852.1 glutathione S-transferase [Penicillium daleae]
MWVWRISTLVVLNPFSNHASQADHSVGPPGGPNPWKVAMILEELYVPYNQKFIEFSDMKREPFESINPNGRVPVIEDPNTGITLWESGAIIEYLLDTYDNQHTISFTPGSKEFFEAKQWLHFQVSGQGPYFGQAVWFTRYHSEQVPSAVDRYVNEIRRVSRVLNHVLENKEYLVGGKFSYVDTAFVPWYGIVQAFFSEKIDLENEFPRLNSWLSHVKARPATTKVNEARLVAIGQA